MKEVFANMLLNILFYPSPQIVISKERKKGDFEK